MFEKYFDGVIEQVYEKITKAEKNIVMACYNNSFSVEGLESIKRYSKSKDNVFFTWKEYSTKDVVGAYEPFLEIICQLYRESGENRFDDFLTRCEVYELHREMLNMYYETGLCKRTEDVLLDEVAYEQARLTKTISIMLKEIAEYRPIVLVLNRFELASRRTMHLVLSLLEHPTNKIGIVLGVNEARIRKETRIGYWEKIAERLNDLRQVYHIGSSGRSGVDGYQSGLEQIKEYSKLFNQLNNMMELMDYEQLNDYFLNLERQIKFESAKMDDNVKLSLYFMHTKVAILMGDFSNALDIIEEITKLDVKGRDEIINYRCAFDIATCFMYQGKLDEAERLVQMAKAAAETIGNSEWVFKAELLSLQIQMSGWHNIFFCVTDVKVDPHIIEKLMQYGYQNHLAHIYIYAFDNRPEVVAKAYRSEAALVNFTKGIHLAKEIGNERLVCNAYQKNAMIASTNGMNEIALLYSVRTYQYVRGKDMKETGRMLSAIGYNLSALGHMDEAGKYYEAAISLFYQLQLPEDIAEVCYNYALTFIAQERYEDAEVYLQQAIKTVEKLNLNSLRVCNLSKLYALQAFLSVMQGNRFDGQRYLLSCAQFLNYILEKQEEEIVHDFARSDDDICLYYFAKAMYEISVGNEEQALLDFEKTEKYFQQAEGNLFFMHALYRRSRMDLFEKLGKVELYEIERASLLQHLEMVEQLAAGFAEDYLVEVLKDIESLPKITKEQIEDIVKQEGLIKASEQNKRQLEFISTWQNLLDKKDVRVAEVVKDSIRLFLNHFNNDCALYVHHDEGMVQVLYNDTGIVFDNEKLKELEKLLLEYPRGIAVSKISHTFFEHRKLIEIFGIDEVCSFVTVPFYKDGKIESYFITFIKMKDNWHDSVNRYLLNEEDLPIYQLLFRELGHAIHRLESYEKIFQMNNRLQAAATTDALTGITNRMGMYERLQEVLIEREHTNKKAGLGVMFLDLDNFKPYNDTYGHEIGDIVLQGMASIFCDAVGDKGFVSRYGGDEFIIITYIHDKVSVEKIAKEIYQKIEEADGFVDQIRRVLSQNIEIHPKDKIGCSIGIALAEEFTNDSVLDDMIKEADDLLYSVKETGKGKYVFA